MQISFVFLWKNMEIKPWLPKKSQKTPNTQTKKTQPKTTRKKKTEQKKISIQIPYSKSGIRFSKRVRSTNVTDVNCCKLQRKSFLQPSGNSNL